MKVVGVGRSSGEYEGYKYDNFLLHGLEDGGKDWVGQRAVICKVPASVFNADVSPVVDADLTKLLGAKVECMYNKYGKVISVRLSGK